MDQSGRKLSKGGEVITGGIAIDLVFVLVLVFIYQIRSFCDESLADTVHITFQ